MTRDMNWIFKIWYSRLAELDHGKKDLAQPASGKGDKVAETISLSHMWTEFRWTCQNSIQNFRNFRKVQIVERIKIFVSHEPK